MTRRVARPHFLLVAALAALAACGDDSNPPRPTPTPVAPASATATAPSAPTATPTRPPPTATSRPSATATVAPSATATRVPTPTPSASATSSPTATPTLSPTAVPTSALRVGVAAVALSPCGANPDYDGPITASGVWGETFTDVDGNGRWDDGEPFVDDPVNTALDPRSEHEVRRHLPGRLRQRSHRQRLPRRHLGARHRAAGADPHGGAGERRFRRRDHARPLRRLRARPRAGRSRPRHRPDHLQQHPLARRAGHARAVGRDRGDATGSSRATCSSSTARSRAPSTPRRRRRRCVRCASWPRRPIRRQSPELRGLQVRTRCRPPFFFDEELRALRFVDDGGATVATLINWNTHPESLEDENTVVSSDFVHYIRARVERELGGTAVYFTGDLGAVEIVGDTCVGGADPHADDGSNEFDSRDDLGFARTEQHRRAGRRRGRRRARGRRAARRRRRRRGADRLPPRRHQPGVRARRRHRRARRRHPRSTWPTVRPARSSARRSSSIWSAWSSRRPSRWCEMITAPGRALSRAVLRHREHHRTDCPAAHTGAAVRAVDPRRHARAVSAS